MALAPPRLLDVTHDHDYRLLPQLAQLHHDLIVNDDFMASFLHPLDLNKMLPYWQAWAEEVRAGSRLIFIQSITHEDSEEVVGAVSLHMPYSGTGPFRSEVHKLMVSPKHRGKGIARMLMAKLEEVALQRDRWLVVRCLPPLSSLLTFQMLDTTIGSGAEYVYPKLGYTAVGIIPNYGFSPKDGQLRNEMFFYKDLRPPGTVTQWPVPQASGSMMSASDKPA